MAYRKIGSFVDQISEKNSDGKFSDVKGISIDKEFMPSVANIIGTDLKKYNVIRKNRFAFNPMHVGRDKRLPISCYEMNEPALVSPAYTMFEVIDKEVKIEYLMLLFKTELFDHLCWFYTDASVRGGLTWENFTNLEVDIPEVKEQEKIVNQYNIITKRIDILNQINDNLLKLLDKYISNKFSNKQEKNSLKEIGYIQGGYAFKSSDFKDYKTNNKVLKIKNIGRTEVDVFNTQYVEDSVVKNLDKKFCLFSGNVIVAMTGAELGKTGFIYGSDNNYYINQRVGLVVGKDIRKELYLNCLFLTSEFQNIIYEKGYGSAQANISSDDIEQIEIYIPTEDELDNFYNFAKPIYETMIKNSEEKNKLNIIKTLVF